jgi:hypothetical protein
MTTIEGLISHPSRVRSIEYKDPLSSSAVHFPYEVPDDTFFSDANINYIKQSVNLRLARLGYSTDTDNILRVMRSIYQSSFYHRDVDFMNKATIAGIVQHIQDDIDFVKMNNNRSKWTSPFFYPESGIVRINGIKLNKKKPQVPVFVFSNV